MMKKLFLNILLIILILALSACSQNKPVKQNFKFKISAMTSGIQLKGGSFVNAITGSSTNLIKLDADHSAEFPSGIYEFQTVSFEGPLPFMGKKYCGRAQTVDLSQATQNISLIITEANCLAEPFISLISKILTNFNASLPLSVTSISPKAGALSGGTTINITGTGFALGATVKIGGSLCTLPVISSTNIQCKTPQHSSGIVNLVVTNTDTQVASLANAYTYQGPPNILSSTPNTGSTSGGTTITIIGSGFLPGATVSLKGVPCILPIVLSSTNIQCTTSASALGPADITVVNTDLQIGSLSNAFTYVLPPPPLAPSELTLLPPETSSTPTINVKGVTTGNTIKIYSDIACTLERASAVASGSTINLISSALPNFGIYKFYAKAIDVYSQSSSCSTANVSYAYYSFISIPQNKIGYTSIASNDVRSVHVDNAGVIYAATAGGLSISTDAGASFTNKTTTHGLGFNFVYGVYVDSAGVIYAATLGGLSISTDAGASFTNKTNTHGLGSNEVYGVYVNSAGVIYAATNGGLQATVTP